MGMDNDLWIRVIGVQERGEVGERQEARVSDAAERGDASGSLGGFFGAAGCGGGLWI